MKCGILSPLSAMRRAPPSLHLLAATDTAAATATSMSSCPPVLFLSLHTHSCTHYLIFSLVYFSQHRGRGRGFSGRPYSGGRGHFISGDAHLLSVREANLGLRRGESGSFTNQTPDNQNPLSNLRPHPPSLHNQRPEFRNRPHSPHFRPHFPQYRQHPPPEHRPTFRPHPPLRPPYYRDWEFALTPPPPHCGNIILVLCDCDLDFYLRVGTKEVNFWYDTECYYLDTWRFCIALFNMSDYENVMLSGSLELSLIIAITSFWF